jgi:hypothetical protein
MSLLTTTTNAAAERREIAESENVQAMAAAANVSALTFAAYFQARTNAALRVRNLPEAAVLDGLRQIAKKHWPNSAPTTDCVLGCLEVMNQYPGLALAEIYEAVALACAQKLPAIGRDVSGNVRVYSNLSSSNLGEILAAYVEDTRKRMIEAFQKAVEKQAREASSANSEQKAAAARTKTIAELAPVWGTWCDLDAVPLYWGVYVSELYAAGKLIKLSKGETSTLKIEAEEIARRKETESARAETRRIDEAVIGDRKNVIYQRLWLVTVIANNQNPA